MKREAEYHHKREALSHVRRLKEDGRDAWHVRKSNGLFVVWSDCKPKAVWV